MIEHANLHLLPFLSPGKILNAVLCHLSLIVSRLLKRPVVWGRPYTLNLESTNHCNLECVECPTGMGTLTRPKGTLSFDTFKTYFDRMKKNLVYVTLYFQGEPFLNRDILRMADYARENRVYSMVSTNGHFFRTDDDCRRILDSGLGSVILSLDGLSEATYLEYRRNGDFNAVMEGITRLARIRAERGAASPRLYLQFLVMKHNEHEMDAVRRFARELGIDRVLFKSVQVYDFKGIDGILPANERYRRYERTPAGAWRIKGTFRNTCRLLWTNTLVTWDGNVVPCCFDKNADHVFGNLDDGPFADIWTGDRYQSFRRTVLTGRSRIPICTNCTEGLRIFN